MSLNLPPPTPNLQYLPAELVDEIAQYMSPISKLSLRYTCHRFRHYFPITIQLMQKQVANKSKSNTGERSQWYNFLRMLERDKRISQLVCSACCQTHHISLFSKKAQRESPRKCLASMGEPWICPHSSFTRSELRILRLSAQSHTRWQPFLADVAGCVKDYYIWRASDQKGKSLFPSQYNCACRKIKSSQHMLFLHLEASRYRLMQARLEKALGMSAAVQCSHVRNPTRKHVGCTEHKDCSGFHGGDPSFKCRLCIENRA